MPNWFYFDLQVEGKQEDVQEFVKNVKGTEKYETEGRDFDFNHFIPQPDNIYRGSLSFKDEERLKEEGIPSWYNWNTQNWGTKWNASVDDIFYEEGSTKAVYRLSTAWAFPSPVINTMLEMYPNLNFFIEGEEESGSYGVHIDTEKELYLVEDSTLVDPETDREIYFKEQDDRLYHPFYKDDDTMVPDAEDFFPKYKFSWN